MCREPRTLEPRPEGRSVEKRIGLNESALPDGPVQAEESAIFEEVALVSTVGVEDVNHNGIVDPGETDPLNPNE